MKSRQFRDMVLSMLDAAGVEYEIRTSPHRFVVWRGKNGRTYKRRLSDRVGDYRTIKNAAHQIRHMLRDGGYGEQV